jgi:DNA-binding winged helix-turn-helix (wHTH) protein/tetratricopeptide (TPR) repeat protein
MSIVAFGPFRLDVNAGILLRGTELIPLGQRATALLSALVEQPGALISKDALVDAAWPGLAVEDSNLSVQIATLRRVLGEAGGADWIETMPRRGYRFVGPAVRAERGNGLSIAKSDRPELPGRAAEPISSVPGDPHLVVGRTAPLEILDQMTQRALAGQRQIAFVTGEAGVGKTAFIAKATERLTGQGFDLLYGRCTERFGTEEVFLPLIDALVTRYRANRADLLPAIRTHAPTWMLQIPGAIDATERAAFQDEMFGATRERMLREFCDLVEALSAERTWAIILEDLHWSDLATLDVLSRFARGTSKASVLVLGSYRPADSAINGHPIRRLHQDLQIHRRCSELHLDRLSPAEVERYLALRFRDVELASHLSGPVFERTQGHPLFVTSVVKHCIDMGAVVEIDGAWQLASQASVAQDSIPNDLINMITHEVDRLPEDDRCLLDVASVAGAEFSAALVAAGLSRDAIDVERNLEVLARKTHLLLSSGASEWPDGTYSGLYSFHHILYQNVIYRHLAPGQRAQTHRRLGQRLEAAYAGKTTEIASVLALHFEEGRDFPGALRYLEQAAESSTKRLGHAEAASYLTRALGILGRFDAPDRLGSRIVLLRQRSLALRSCGDLAGSVRDLKELIACARQSGKLQQEINGLLAVSQFCLYTDRRVCLQATEDALARSRALDDGAFKVLVQGAIASINLSLKGWREQDAALCTKAMELSADARDHGTLIRHCVMEGTLDFWRSRYQECRRSGTQGKRLAREAGDIYVFALLNILESIALIHLGEWRELQQETTTALELAEKNANKPASALCRLTLAWLHAEAMDFDEALGLCERVDDKILKEDQRAYFFHRAVLAKAFMGLGRPQQVRKQFEDIWRRMEEGDAPLDFAISMEVYHSLGEFYLQIGDLAQAKKWVNQLHDYVAPAPDHNHLAQAYELFARIAFAKGDRSEALTQLSRALSIVETDDFPLAAWRVYAAAAEIFAKCGEADKAATCRIRFVDVLRRLAGNFEPEDRLHKSLVAALTARVARLEAVG